MKYIIEIEEKPLCVFDKDTQTYFPRLWRVKGFNSLVFDEEGLSRLEELNSDYINEHYGDLQDDAYERGHGIGYQKGFEDGKAVNDKGCEGCKYAEIGSDTTICAQCCIAYYNQWTAKQTDSCIEIGDEVEWDGDKYIVTYRNMDINTGVIQDYDLMMWDGSVVDHVKKCSFVKTGNHYDISSILKEMQS